jgi:uncharacterized protein
MMDRIDLLMKLTRSYYEKHTDPSHDWAHILRVVSTAEKLAAIEGAHREITVAAVLCHDLVNLPKDHPDRARASTLAAEEADPLLEQAQFTSGERERIRKAIVEHSYSRGLKPSSLEGAIVQDADRLDALGAIGILRCAAVNTLMKSQFYDPAEPVAKSRVLDDKKFMLDHYFVKLFKLPELMNTTAARHEAKKRVAVMENFLETLLGEITLRV